MFGDATRVFRALGDETRRGILDLLREGPRTSGQIADAFDSSWPTISRHLTVLRDAGLVRAQRRGQEIHYEIDMSVFQEIAQHLLSWSAPATDPRGVRAPEEA